MKFEPSFEVIDHIDALPRWSDFKDEKMFYQSSPKFVLDNGGPIARTFIEKLFDKVEYIDLNDNVIVDIRIHHLQEGFYPAIPGYHLDWIPRKNKGQDIDLSTIPFYDHVVLILGETSLTEFVDQPTEFPDDLISFNPVNTFLKNIPKFSGQPLKTWNVSNGDMVYFTSRDWHRPVAAQGTEWRMLIRASRVDHVRPSNQIRTQAQVYIPIQEASW